ncbi:hypothetical protein LNO36_10915 [Klebsiella variicola subsp. variicola]|nr:hypothetical protein [Klebsiella variicola subsp. variicola]
MTKQSKTKVTKAQMVLAIVSRTPECVLQDVCDALDLQASTAGNLLRQLHAAGKLHRTHNGCQYVYRVVAGVEVPDIALPQAATPLSEEDVKRVQDALSLAKTLEDKKAVAPGCDCLHIDARNDDNIKRALVACQNAQPLPAQRSEILIMAKERNCRRCGMFGGLLIL